MRSELKKLLAFLVVVAMALAGCGGGDGSDSYSVPAEYTGEPGQATLTSQNAKDIVLEAFEGGSDLANLGGALPVQVLAEGEQAGPLAIAGILEQAVQQVEPASQAQMAVTADCTLLDIEGATGTACYTLDSVSADSYSGTMIFEAFSEDGTISLTGTVGFAVSYNPATGDTQKMALTYKSTTVDMNGEKFTLNGGVSFVSSQNAQISFRMVMKSQTTEWQAFYDFTYVIVAGPDTNGEPDYDEVSVSGRFYSGEHGYVIVSTETPLRTLAADFWPSSGQLRFDGAASSATMTFGAAAGDYTIQYSGSVEPIIGVLTDI